MPSVQVEVVYALPDHQISVALEVDQDATVRDCVIASGILRVHPEIDLDTAGVGVWSQRVAMDCVVRNGDRVEIYRPLIADPKVIRRQRARSGKSPRRREQT